MTASCNARILMVEQIRLINECSKSGMADVEWCRRNDITVITFYNGISYCGKAVVDRIVSLNYVHLESPSSKQEEVHIDIALEQPAAS